MLKKVQKRELMGISFFYESKLVYVEEGGVGEKDDSVGESGSSGVAPL